jgi:tRNA threonylcarbamoyladenosine biosynthesis protein TsaB
MILGLDTATPATAVAVWSPDGLAVERRDDPPPGERPGHASRLLALVDEVVEDWAAIDRIAVGIGPGGFTGLRIGIATARALAQARDLPLVGVSSLAALAAGVRPLESGPLKGSDPLSAGPLRGSDPLSVGALKGSDPVVAVIDARRGEVFAASPGRFEPVALKPDALAARIGPGTLAVGDGAVRFRTELERAGAVVPADGSPQHRVSALEVCRLGAAAEPTDRDALLPDYRREPDAKPRQQ